MDEHAAAALSKLNSVQRVLALVCSLLDGIKSGFSDCTDLAAAKGPRNESNRRRNNRGNELQQQQTCVEEKEAALQEIADNIVAEGAWQNVLCVWSWQGRQPRSFRVSTVRGGKHNFTSVELSGWVGAAIAESCGWQVDLRNYDAEVVIVVSSGRTARNVI